MKLNRLQHPAFNKIEHINFPKVEQLKLDNNIPLYVIKGGSQPVIKLDLMANAGAIFGDKKLVAPIAAIMLNEGTRERTAHEIAEIFDFYGAYFQPTTEKDMAFIGLFSLTKHLEKTLPLFYDTIENSTLPKKELATLFQRRKQNFLVDMEKTSFVARELFNEQLFGKEHPYGVKTKVDDYENTMRDDVYNFYKSHYNSSNYQLILSGQVTDAHIKLINSNIGQTTSKTPIDLPVIKPQPSYSQDPTVSIKNDAVQSSIRMGCLTINKFHADYPALKILITIFGGYFGSRLMKNIREEKGYTYGIHAMLVSLRNGGCMGIGADVKAEHTKEAVVEIKKEMDKLCQTKVSANELALVQNYMMGEMLQMFDGSFASSDTFKGVLQYGMGFEYFERMKQTILNITPEKIQAMAIKYFNTDKLITVVAGKYE
jgi:zinc protease